MGHEEQYPTSAALDSVVRQMYAEGIAYAEAVSQFQKQFILTVMQDLNWNASKAAPVLRMHRNTLRRTLRELKLDIHDLRTSQRRPTQRVDARNQKKLAG
jgi:Fis family transcriptional regulator, factor for inversion stimulation protein